MQGNSKAVAKRILKSMIGDYAFNLMMAKIKRGTIHNYEEAEWIYRYFKSSRKHGVMIDVGAHLGESFAPYLRLGWTIYAFEPDPKNYEKIPANKRLRLYDYAISDHEEDAVPFYSSDESSGISTLSAFRDTHKETARVKMTTLRKIIESEHISAVDYLKVDAEGHDLFCLRGFPFEKTKPEIIMCEFENSKTVPLGYTYENLGDFLVDKGYHVVLSEWEPITRYGIEHKWRAVKKYPAKLDNDEAWGNFIAFATKDNLTRMLDSIRVHQSTWFCW